MSDLFKRKRNQTLIITEGNHEKNRLLKLILHSFPEMNISEDKIIIYESNIYNLYNKIVKEYGDDWKEQDVDLPKCVSKWKSCEQELSKNNFTNIILIFDYERHDPYFSEAVICELQEYFSDINDNGQLFINYPMVESYLDVDVNRICDFENYSFPAHIETGACYKNSVKNRYVYRAFSLLDELIMHLNDVIQNKNLADQTAMDTLKIYGAEDLQEKYYLLFKNMMRPHVAKTMSYQYSVKISNLDYDSESENYFEYIRNLFLLIVKCNICKACKLQGGDYYIDKDELKEFYGDALNYMHILLKQNNDSRDINSGIVWVLNTSLFIIANYKFFWK